MFRTNVFISAALEPVTPFPVELQQDVVFALVDQKSSRIGFQCISLAEALIREKKLVPLMTAIAKMSYLRQSLNGTQKISLTIVEYIAYQYLKLVCDHTNCWNLGTTSAWHQVK